MLPSIPTVDRTSNSDQSSTMEQAEDLVDDTRVKLEFRMRMYTVLHLDSYNLDQHESEIKEIRSIILELNVAITKLVKKFSAQLGQQRVNELKAEIPLIEEKFVVYRDSFKSKLNELRKPTSPSMNNHASLGMPSINNLTLSDSFKVQQSAAVKKVKAKLDAISEDLVKLSTRASKIEDWSVATDLMVQRGMKENQNLRKEFDRINGVMRVVKELMAEFDLDEARDGLSLLECEIKLLEVSKEVDATIEAIEEQDDVRELYSLDEAKVDKIKLPTFSGKESEDYEKFKSDLLKGFAQNRVTQADKLAKLRECLFGEAKRLVPHSISSSVTEALKVLDKAYGDPIRLFRFRKEHFLKLGKQPKNNDKGGYRALVEWYRDVEVSMESLLALAVKDETCAETLFSPPEMNSYLRMFDKAEFEKLGKCEGRGEARFRKWLVKIAKFREEAQSYALIMEDEGGLSSKVNNSSGKNSKGNPSSKAVQPSLAMFKPPRRHEECRVCNQLSKNGDTRLLYDNHSSNFPTGCPRYIGMSIEERRDLCKQAKICIKCNDPS